jgi:hypothetical protein
MQAVAGLQIGDVRVLGVGDQSLVAQAVGIEEVVAGAGMRLFPAHQDAGSLGPQREVQPRGDLGHLRSFSLLHLLGDRHLPAPLWQLQDRLPHRLGHIEAH